MLMMRGPIPIPDDVVRAGLQDVYLRGYMKGMRRVIIVRLMSRFGREGLAFGPWLAEFSEAASLDSFFEAIETVTSIEELFPLLPLKKG
jgi:hypothetical protein